MRELHVQNIEFQPEKMSGLSGETVNKACKFLSSSISENMIRSCAFLTNRSNQQAIRAIDAPLLMLAAHLSHPLTGFE